MQSTDISKKNTLNLLIQISYYVSFFLVIAGIFLTLFTPQILEYLPGFLEEKVFHRTFNHEAYKESMLSLIVFPMFIAIVLDALVFVRLSDKKKTAIILAHLLAVLITLTITSYATANAFADQDLSSETLFGYECFRSKTFWPTSWYYSMEFRFLNTQLLTAPLFLFTKNLALVRALTVLLTEIVLFFSTYFLLHELQIKKIWIKLLCCTLMVSPVSWTFFCYVQAGSYYIPHIVFSFFYVGLFISLTYREHSVSKQKRISVIFLILAFLSGVSSIRYILNFTFPVFVVIATKKFFELKKENAPLRLKTVFVTDKKIFFSTTGLLLSGIGYVFNSVVIASLFTFKNMNKIRFNSLDEIKLDAIKDMILGTAGYNGNISVFTPGGVANVLLLIVFILTIVIIKELLKSKDKPYQNFLILFSVFFFAFHLYTNICTEMVGRYFTMVFVFFIPILAITLENETISSLKKWVFAASSTVLILSNAYICFERMQAKGSSLKLDGVCAFLLQNDYEFGYAFSNIANPIWFFSNGAIEVATIEDDESDGTRVMPQNFAIHKWLQPKRYKNSDYYKGEKHVFFAIKQEEYALSSNQEIFKKGNLVYQDASYLIFDYDSPANFIHAFDN